MAPGPRPSAARVVVALVTAVVMVASGCGGSDDGEQRGGGVLAEPVSGRQAVPSTTGRSVATAAVGVGRALPTTGSTAVPTSPTSSTTSVAPTAAVDGEAVATVVRTGADVVAGNGFDLLSGRRVGLIANRASTVGGEPLIDVLHAAPDIDLVALFAPEHGVEAKDAAGAIVAAGTDALTGVVVHSLYGADRAPRPESLADLDVLVFDLQGVGARFYTYISTLGLAMQSAARAGVPMVVLDRPNPLGGDRPDGSLRTDGASSFVGLYPIPALHGLTVGELALAVRGEGWLEGIDSLDLTVVELDGWDRSQRWEATGLPWVAPSPGLPSAELSLLYPATVLLEATTLSFGRGTDRPFGQVGSSWLDVPALIAELEAAELPGVAFEPVRFVPGDDGGGADGSTDGAGGDTGDEVPGVRLTVTDPATLRPFAVGVHLVDALLRQAGDRPIIDRPDFFDLLAGGPDLRRALLDRRDPAAIVDDWTADLAAWERTRGPYLLYGPAGS
ncbi:MAG: DUF1343 domain-containing protein [Actinomycetota bacterium]